jgi:hydroxymethylpyrimidine/phosphomethylpyrimidine kinase
MAAPALLPVAAPVIDKIFYIRHGILLMEKRKEAAVLAIAGSDPSGGAGIQADLKTLAVIGVYGAAAITCLTAQNTLGVASVLPVAPEMVSSQIGLVLADLPVTHVKIGMVGTSAIAVAIGEALADFSGEVIYDPVLNASTGGPLLEESALAEVAKQVIGRATVLTPNIPELQIISGITCASREEILQAGRWLFARYAKLRAIIVKGGHAEIRQGMTTDYLLLPGFGEHFDWRAADHPWLETDNSHGTGCTFASAFAAFHLLSGNYQQAFASTTDFLAQLLTISADSRMGHGKGPLLHHRFRIEPR